MSLTPTERAPSRARQTLGRARALRQIIISAGLLGLVVLPLTVETGSAQQASPPANQPPAPANGPSPYLLPWEGGKKFIVTQTQGSTHHGAMSNAIDFGLPRGERITAARAGKVAFREDRYAICGGPELATKGNYVVIDHGDGTNALYLHLDSVSVAAGQAVQQGDLLGTNGTTGWTGCAAHLHFQVQQNWGVWFSRSLPVVFNDPDVRQRHPSGAVQYNQSYVSGNRGLPPAPAANPPVPDAPGAPTSSPTPTPVATAGPSAAPHAASNGQVNSREGASANNQPSHTVVTTAASLREQPTTASRRLAWIYPNQSFEVIEPVIGQAVEPGENRWFRIKMPPLDGFVYAGLLQGPALEQRPTQPAAPSPTPAAATPSATAAVTPSPTPSPTPSATPVPLRLGINENLEAGQWQTRVNAVVRAQPTRAATLVGSLAAGTPVRILGVVAGEEVEAGEPRWAQISFNGQVAYMYLGVLVTGSLDPVDEQPEVPAGALAGNPGSGTNQSNRSAPEDSASPAQALGSTLTRSDVSVRAQPNSRSARLGVLDAGVEVEMLEFTDGEEVEAGHSRWARIRSGGLVGYVYAAYLTLQ